ncbi:MAG: hypothetical protein ACP5EQ_07970 [Candidatus Cloacimonadia bacterium]
MIKNKYVNLKAVETVASVLNELNEEILYVGGAVLSLYATDEGADQPRPTTDIDISVQVSTYSQMDQLRIRLATKNIFPALTEKVLYRYKYKNILIDFIPYEETPLGPTNRWLKPGFSKAIPFKLGSNVIRILPVSLFLASKWEAYKSRGSDPRMSHDFEDIIYVIENNKELVEDVRNAGADVHDFLKNMSKEILTHPSRDEIIECHLNPIIMEDQKNIIINKLERISVT